MVRRFAAAFYRLGILLAWIDDTIKRVVEKQDEPLGVDFEKALTPKFLEVRGCCEVVGLKFSILAVDRLIAELSSKNISAFRTALAELKTRISDELNSSWFLYIPDDVRPYYNNSSLFGDEVAKKFPDASFDIEQAGNCFATINSTASVMHLMRALEVALDAIGLGVGVADIIIEARNSWERLFREIKKQIELNDKSADATWPPKRQFFVDSEAHLFSVKNAWRNPSMHLEKKYDQVEAERILRAIKDFMQHLATHLDQTGQFTA